MTTKPSGSVNQPNLEDLLRLGINTAKAGNRENAQVIFKQVIDQDKRNERAWLWLASVEEDEIERRRILKTVLDINPANETAKKLMAELDNVAQSSEQQSMRVGLMILGIAVAVLVVAVLLVILFTR